MARMMAREWVKKGVNVNIIQPGYFPTEMTDEVFQTDIGKALMATFPRRRLCDMETLNVPLLFLCSDMAQGVTGSVFTVDDGQTL
jgi:NAD(P)-dependent dehydrogenase (short-subunit alcohol dehydrogenase family)